MILGTDGSPDSPPNYLVVPQPDIVKRYNNNMGDVRTGPENQPSQNQDWREEVLLWHHDLAPEHCCLENWGKSIWTEFQEGDMCVIFLGQELGLTAGNRLATPGEAEPCFDCVVHFVVVRWNTCMVCVNLRGKLPDLL